MANTSEKSNKDKNVANTYIELYRYEKNTQFERALKTTNRLLQINPDDTTALHCKIVCLLQLSKFFDALNLIKKQPPAPGRLTFEKAYCQYRLNQPTDALATILEADGPEYRLSVLKAQVLYRLENFKDAFDLYLDVSKVSHDENEDELTTNLSAALVYADAEDIGRYGAKLGEANFEHCFNRACQLISLGRYAEAEKKLRQCENLCREAMEEDESEDDVQAELAYVKLQLGYVYQKQGRIREAQQIYAAVLKLKLDDVALTVVASNNSVVINKDQNVFDSKKKMKAAANEQLNVKLLARQRKCIAWNNALFTFYTNQLDQCAKSCAIIKETWPDMTVDATVIEGLLLAKEDRYEEALALWSSCATRNDAEKLYLQLACAQLCLMKGDRSHACRLFEATGDNRYRLGIVGALITLYRSDGKEETAQKIYRQTVEWYKSNKKTDGDIANLWRQAADFHLDNGQTQIAANCLEELLLLNPNDKKIIGQLILAYAQFDRRKAIGLSSRLYTMQELCKDLDTESAESSVWLNTKKQTPSTRSNNSPSLSGALSVESIDLNKQRKRSKRRRGKLPKNYDPNVPPDPDRWLPKHERGCYRRKRDYEYSKAVQECDVQSTTSSAEHIPLLKVQPKYKGPVKKKIKNR